MSILGKSQKLTVIAVAFGIVLGAILPGARVFAETHGEGEYELSVSVDSNEDWVALLTIGDEVWSEGDTYLDADGKYTMFLELHVPNEEVRDTVSVRSGGDTQIEVTPTTNQVGDLGDAKKYVFMISYQMPDGEFREHVSLNPYAEDGQGGGSDWEEEENVIFEGCDEEAGCDAFVISDPDSDQVVVFLSTLWHMKYVGDVVINGQTFAVSDYIDYEDQRDYLEHYGGQVVGFSIEVEKPEDGVYHIEVQTERCENGFVGNFLWTADPSQEFERDEDGEIILDEDGNPVPGRDYIGHARIQMMAVEFTLGGDTFKCDVATMSCSIEGEDGVFFECSLIEDEGCGIPYIEYETNYEETGYDDGSLVVPAGARLTLQVIPDYGYQVMNVNMAELVTRDGVGEFSFIVPGGAAYFVADVVETEDSVKIQSEKVKSGEIKLGDEQTTLEVGTARLEVSDIELGEDEMEEFAGAAEGYEIKDYLNISLNNVFYKGTEDEVWAEEVKELNEEAEVVLELEEGVDGTEIVIVHQKDDGSYEVIPAEYDAETHTIRFKTSSFSNYAIASRGGTPNTGRMTGMAEGMAGKNSIAMVFGAGVIALVIGCGFVVRRRGLRK